MEKEFSEQRKNLIHELRSKEILFDIGDNNIFELLVPKTVYPPREDSKLLIDSINQLNEPSGQALEIGCGSGIISIVLAKKGWHVQAIDVNPYAVISTRENALRAGVEKLISVNEGGLGEKNFEISKDTKLIVWNLPYLSPPQENEQRLEWIEEASMSDLEGRGWGGQLLRFLESNKENINPELLILLLQRKYPTSPSKTSYWAELGWSHRMIESRWLFDEKLEVLAYWSPGLGTAGNILDECESTMDEIKKLPLNKWQRLMTKKQTIGRGRRGSTWTSKNNDLLATWSLEKSLINQISPGLLQVSTGSKISRILNQYCKWPNDIVDSKGNKIGGVLVEMDSESDNLRIGVGINQFSDENTDLVITGWKEMAPKLELEELFPIIDAELSTLFEKHPLLKNKIDIKIIRSDSWRSLSKLISRGYSLDKHGVGARITGLMLDGSLSISSNNCKKEIQDLDSLKWLF